MTPAAARRWLIGLEAVVAVGAIAAGLMMILRPGEGVSMGDEVLADLGYHSWRAPGLFLLGFMGLFPVLVAAAEVRRHPLAAVGHAAAGATFMGWIVVQVLRIGMVSWLQPAIFGVGAAVVSLAWWGFRPALQQGLRGSL